jgi:hypothetical protein
MAMGREGEVQGDLMMSWAEMPRSPGHVFYDRLQKLSSPTVSALVARAITRCALARGTVPSVTLRELHICCVTIEMPMFISPAL